MNFIRLNLLMGALGGACLIHSCAENNPNSEHHSETKTAAHLPKTGDSLALQSQPEVGSTLSALKAPKNLATSSTHTCAIKSDSIYCWGKNTFGSLGNTSQVDSSLPVKVTNLGDTVRKIVNGLNFSCAIVGDKAKCWGRGDVGQLGNGSRANSSVPVEVGGLVNVKDITAGAAHACAIANDGESEDKIYCWGSNSAGQLGDRSKTDRLVPTRIGADIGDGEIVSAGRSHTCALLKNQTIHCWGQNSAAQLGLGDNPPEDTYNRNVINIQSSGITHLSSGDYHNCLIQSGGLKCWGKNGAGQTLGYYTPNVTQPQLVGGFETGVTAVASAANHTCAIKDDAIKCFGWNEFGQLGNGTFEKKVRITHVLDLQSNIQEISTGSDASHTCATSLGSIKCWGFNGNGQLGTGNTTNAGRPVEVVFNKVLGCNKPTFPRIDIRYEDSAGQSNYNFYPREFNVDSSCNVLIHAVSDPTKTQHPRSILGDSQPLNIQKGHFAKFNSIGSFVLERQMGSDGLPMNGLIQKVIFVNDVSHMLINTTSESSIVTIDANGAVLSSKVVDENIYAKKPFSNMAITDNNEFYVYRSEYLSSGAVRHTVVMLDSNLTMLWKTSFDGAYPFTDIQTNKNSDLILVAISTGSDNATYFTRRIVAKNIRLPLGKEFSIKKSNARSKGSVFVSNKTRDAFYLMFSDGSKVYVQKYNVDLSSTAWEKTYTTLTGFRDIDIGNLTPTLDGGVAFTTHHRDYGSSSAHGTVLHKINSAGTEIFNKRTADAFLGMHRSSLVTDTLGNFYIFGKRIVQDSSGNPYNIHSVVSLDENGSERQ